MTKKIILVVGVVLLAAGALGFWNNPIFGVFAVDTLHNIIHLATGAIAIAYALKGESSAKNFARIFGVVYAIIAIAGFTLSGDDGKILGFLAANNADHILHTVIALLLLALGFRRSAQAVPTMPPPMEGPSMGM